MSTAWRTREELTYLISWCCEEKVCHVVRTPAHSDT